MSLPAHPRRTRTVALALALCLLTLPAIAVSSPFDCSADGRCGLHGDGPYPHLVLGTVVVLADSAEAERIFHWARAQGYWADLPEDPAAFAEATQALSVEIPRGEGTERMTLLMGRKHYEPIGIAPGDYVRYVPREAYPGVRQSPARAKDAEADPYRALYGCIALLCRAEDLLCPARYRSGIYRQADGAPLDAHTGTVLTHGTYVHPATYLPVASPPDEK